MVKFKRLYFLYSLLILISCNKVEDEGHLIGFQITYVGERNDGQLDSKQILTTGNDVKVTYVDDVIIASKVIEVNACGKYNGILDVRQDTIVLKYESQSDELCDSQDFRRFTYVIANSENKKFKIYMKDE
ncbi:MAG: hypothetical protein IR153_00100 [Flavobacterium sp.]|nr:hypothetical protein [Flavobacterium sp.]